MPLCKVFLGKTIPLKSLVGTDSLAQQLSMFAVLTQNPNLVPNTHVG